MGPTLPITTLYVPISQGCSNLGELLGKVESGDRVIFTSHGKPKAVLTSFSSEDKPWRVEQSSDPTRFGDLQSPVIGTLCHRDDGNSNSNSRGRRRLAAYRSYTHPAVESGVASA